MPAMRWNQVSQPGFTRQEAESNFPLLERDAHDYLYEPEYSEEEAHRGGGEGGLSSQETSPPC